MNTVKINQLFQTGCRELRLPLNLAAFALTHKHTRALHLLLILKAMSSRVQVKRLHLVIGISQKTLQRTVNKLLALQWIGSDGQYIFTRSWSRMGYQTRKGILLQPEFLKDLKTLEALAFTAMLKRFNRRKEYRARKSGRATPKAFPSGYYSKAFKVSLRRFERLKRNAIELKFITSKRHYTVLGKAEEVDQIRRNLHGPVVFVKGKNTVSPEACEIWVQL